MKRYCFSRFLYESLRYCFILFHCCTSFYEQTKNFNCSIPRWASPAPPFWLVGAVFYQRIQCGGRVSQRSGASPRSAEEAAPALRTFLLVPLGGRGGLCETPGAAYKSKFPYPSTSGFGT
jgi:hypothetical protein